MKMALLLVFTGFVSLPILTYSNIHQRPTVALVMELNVPINVVLLVMTLWVLTNPEVGIHGCCSNTLQNAIHRNHRLDSIVMSDACCGERWMWTKLQEWFILPLEQVRWIPISVLCTIQRSCNSWIRLILSNSISMILISPISFSFGDHLPGIVNPLDQKLVLSNYGDLLSWNSHH